MLIALLTSACDDSNVNSDGNNDSTDKSPEILLPLAIGNQWVTKAFWYNPDGSVVRSHIDTLLITDTTTLDGKLYFISNKGNYYFNDTNGLWIFYGSPSGNSNYFKFPAAVGDTFNSVLYVSDDGKDTTFTWVELMSKDVWISVEAGTFVCYQYKYFDDYPKMPEGDNTFITPGIGFIKREYFGTDNDGNSFPEEIYTLIDFKLN